jgi:orotidine-5'-phosphate decarboxylase
MQNNIDLKTTDSKITDSKIIVALDYADAASALKLVNQLDPTLCKLKVGKELFTAAGPQLVEQLVAKNFKVFLDLKFHDIPNTVAKACEAASKLGVWMLNVHASGGSAMMQAAAEGVDIGSQGNANKPLLIAVTVLTSMNQSNLTEIGVESSVENQVLKLAKLTQQAGLHGVVCSAQEASMLRAQLGNALCLVTPGIRPALENAQVNMQVNRDDQARVVTPADALNNGASYLVIGRPITQAANPLQALEAIAAECLAATRLHV